MKLQDIIEILSKLLNKNINQSMIADALNITRQTVSNRIKNNSEVTVSELVKIEDFFNVNLTTNSVGIFNNDVMVNYYPDIFVSCGEGAVVFSECKETYKLPQNLISKYSPAKKYSIIHARGDSMAPGILDNDKLIIESYEGEQIIDNSIYVFCYKDEWFVKRLSKNVDEIMVKSDNPEYNLKIIKNENINDIYLIGIVVGMIRNI